jgi:osmotically-inducible protein OsmY
MLSSPTQDIFLREHQRHCALMLSFRRVTMSRALHILNVSLAGVVSVCMSGALASERPVSAYPIAQLIADQAHSDEQIKYTVEERLRTDGRIDWEMLDVDVQQGFVTLYGEVLTETRGDWPA